MGPTRGKWHTQSRFGGLRSGWDQVGAGSGCQGAKWERTGLVDVLTSVQLCDYLTEARVYKYVRRVEYFDLQHKENRFAVLLSFCSNSG